MHRLLAGHDSAPCLGLTPDGHLCGHEPIRFDPVLATEGVIRLAEENLADFLHALGIGRVAPVGHVPKSGNLFSEEELTELLETGDPVPPVKGIVVEDEATVHRSCVHVLMCSYLHPFMC